MSTVSTAPITQSPLTDPEKSRKTRLCPAVFVTFGLLFVELIFYFFINRTFGFAYYNFLIYPNYDQKFFQVVIYNIVIFAFYLLALTALIIVFFTKKRNLILPVVLFFTFTIPEFLDCVLDFIYKFNFYDFRYDSINLYLLSFISLSCSLSRLILKFSIPAVSFLFLLKPPKKKILKNLLIFLTPAVYFVFYFVSEIIYAEINGLLRYAIREAVFVIPLISLLFFFVLRWLANPYKKDKNSAPQIKVVQPAAPIPPAPPAPVRVAVNSPAVTEKQKTPANFRPNPVVQPKAEVDSSLFINDIVKCKELLDNGTLTQEEFEKAKQIILNR